MCFLFQALLCSALPCTSKVYPSASKVRQCKVLQILILQGVFIQVSRNVARSNNPVLNPYTLGQASRSCQCRCPIQHHNCAVLSVHRPTLRIPWTSRKVNCMIYEYLIAPKVINAPSLHRTWYRFAELTNATDESPSFFLSPSPRKQWMFEYTRKWKTHRFYIFYWIQSCKRWQKQYEIALAWTTSWYLPVLQPYLPSVEQLAAQLAQLQGSICWYRWCMYNENTRKANPTV